ncbi:MAG: thrombospondin type 3 repeat family protein, partial [Actinobacteria bacterium]|nr:thrombospondin type 3 repeat family protein [Actinomycetota bacterium]
MVNSLPVISGSPATEAMVGEAYRFVPVASDADGDALSFAIANAPSWTSFDPASGSLSGTPGAGDTGLYSGIVISVSDGFGSVDLAPFAITVSDRPNRPPTISGTAPGSVTVGNPFEFTPAASDPDGDTLTFSVVGLPSWAAFDPLTGRVSGVPDTGDIGVYTGIGITVSDGEDSASLAPFSVTVSGLPNQPPTISGTPPLRVTVGNSYVFSPDASDPDGDSLSFSIAGLPSWADFNAASGTLSGTPSAGDEGVYSGVRISVTDGRDTVSLPLFSITVDAVPNTAPTISGTPAGSVTVGSAYEFAPSASDADGDPLAFSIAGRPPWASFSPDSGRLSGTPSAGDEGVYADIRISVSDGQDTASLPAFAVVVDGLPNAA